MMNQQPDESTQTIGMQLRVAREQLGLSQKEAGRQLKLPASLIQALEEDNTAHMSSVYLKGYLRSYARLLELNESDLCASLAEGQSVPLLQPALPSRGSYTWLESTGKVAGYLVVTAFVVAPLVWWFTQGAVRLSFDEGLVSSQQNTPVNTGQTGSTGADPAAGSTAGDAHLQASAAPFISLRNNEANRAVNAEGADNDTVTDALAGDIPDAQTAADQPDSPASGESVDGESEALAATTEVTAEEAVDPDADQLRLQMLNDSWVEITDADGQRLEYDLLSAGRIKSYAGKAPFKLLFGRASAVELFLNNEHIDLSPYTRGNVASTTLASNRASAAETGQNDQPPPDSGQ